MMMKRIDLFMKDILYQGELREISDFIRHFEINWNLFLKRYTRYKELEENATIDNFDYSTYFDILVVQIRAMCIENELLKNNYTVQNVLRRIGEEKLAEKIDFELERPLSEIFVDKSTGKPITLRNSIKMLADKFICHYDNFDGEKDVQREIAISIEANLKNIVKDVNIHTFINMLIECINKGFFIC